MKSSRSLFVLKITAVIIFVSVTSQISAQTNHPSFEPLFNLNVNSEKYSADEVFETALLFSECEKDSELWNSCWQKFNEIKQTVTSSFYKNLTEEERGRAILKYLYNDYLKSYSLNQTKLDAALETGIYNCVSSAILYMAAAKAAGLEVRGQRTTQHAFCSIYVPDANSKSGHLKKVDVETTNPYGFSPGSKEEIENENQIKQYYVVPKKYYSNRAEVSDGIFTGLIAGNLCSDYIKTGDYNKAVPLGASRWQAVSNENSKSIASVRKEFDILACNYVNILPDTAKEYYSKLEWFSSFIERWGKTDFLQKNLENTFSNLIILCHKESDYELASEAFENYKSKISQTQLKKAEEIIADIFINVETQNLSINERIEKIEALLAAEELSSSVKQNRTLLYLEKDWLEYLNSFMKARDFENGYIASKRALVLLPKSSKVKTMHDHFYNNTIAQIHNNFAKLANAKEYAEAQLVLEEGLAKYPENKTLIKDLADLQKYSAQ